LKQRNQELLCDIGNFLPFLLLFFPVVKGDGYDKEHLCQIHHPNLVLNIRRLPVHLLDGKNLKPTLESIFSLSAVS